MKIYENDRPDVTQKQKKFQVAQDSDAASRVKMFCDMGNDTFIKTRKIPTP